MQKVVLFYIVGGMSDGERFHHVLNILFTFYVFNCLNVFYPTFYIYAYKITGG